MSIFDSPAALPAPVAEPYQLGESEMAAAAFLATYTDGRSMLIGTTCAPSSGGPRAPTWTSSKPPVPTSSCTAPLWRSGALLQYEPDVAVRRPHGLEHPEGS